MASKNKMQVEIRCRWRSVDQDVSNDLDGLIFGGY